MWFGRGASLGDELNPGFDYAVATAYPPGLQLDERTLSWRTPPPPVQFPALASGPARAYADAGALPARAAPLQAATCVPSLHASAPHPPADARCVQRWMEGMVDREQCVSYFAGMIASRAAAGDTASAAVRADDIGRVCTSVAERFTVRDAQQLCGGLAGTHEEFWRGFARRAA